MLSTIWREAPLRLSFERSPRLAANAAPAAICCFFDLAGMGSSWNAAPPEASKLPVQAENVQRGRKFRTEGNNVRRLSRRCLDRRRAIGPSLRYAVVEPALLEHRIGEPNPPAHHEDEEKQQHGVGDPALTRGL